MSTSLKTISIDKELDTIINEGINLPSKSMKGFCIVAGERDSEKAFNPDITEVKVIVDGILNKVYSQRNGDKRYVGRGLQKIW